MEINLTGSTAVMNEMAGSTAQIGGTRYKEVKQGMLAALAAGEWRAGEAIPSEKRLGERFGVSIGTLRKAIDELVAENILIRHQGLGTFVTVHRRDHHFFRFFRVVRKDGVKAYPTVSLVSFRRGKARGEVSEKLALEPGARVFHFTNQLALHGDVMMIDNITLPESLFPGLSEAALRERPSTLYSFYQDAFGINVLDTSERLHVTVADEKESQLLQVPLGTPLLEVARVAYSYHGQPVELRISHVNTAHYEYIGSEAGNKVAP
jgi:GntR family transcriptional regulator